MKKNNFIYALLCAIALAGAGGLSSCTSEDEVVDVNPGYNQETGEVPVQFVFNVATGNTPVTRMSEANVQALETSTFRGMDDTALMSFKVTNSDETPNNGKHITSPQTADVHYALGPILGYNAIGVTINGTNKTEKTHRVLELAIPAGTNTVMFWAKAAKDANQHHQQGKISYNLDKDLNNIYFSLTPILLDDTDDTYQTKQDYGKAAFLQYQNLIAAVLNKIIHTTIENKHITYKKDENSIEESIDIANLSWSDYAKYNTTSNKLEKRDTDPSATDEKPLGELGKILSNSFVLFNNIDGNELRAGSGYAVRVMLVDLYTVIHKVAEAIPTSLEEAVAGEMGKAIRNNIIAVLNSTQTAWKDLSSVKSESKLNTAETNLIKEATGEVVLEKFPSNFDMPDGSALLECRITNDSEHPTRIEDVVFSYRQTVPTYNMGGTEVPFSIYDYMYPAELCYFGNSPIRATNDTHVPDDYPQGSTTWSNDASWIAGATGTNSKAWTKDGVVLSSTRSVAMRDNINYGTSLLKSTVSYGNNMLKDNNKGLHPMEEDNIIEVTANTFSLKGIIIGGQERTVGWNYLPNASTPAFTNMIYDNALANESKVIPAAGGSSSPNYTLVWDNWNGKTGQKQNVVYVALEFVNNSGEDFWGENNLIRNGATFYIAGQLDPGAPDNGGLAWPDKYALPPYDANGNTIQEKRVFIQDYMTTANFVIGENSLKKAMVSVPDLREAQISLGLNVDLNWSTGMTFDNIVLGGEDDNSGSTTPTPEP